MIDDAAACGLLMREPIDIREMGLVESLECAGGEVWVGQYS